MQRVGLMQERMWMLSVEHLTPEILPELQQVPFLFHSVPSATPVNHAAFLQLFCEWRVVQ
jgi:hypothetical protein